MATFKVKDKETGEIFTIREKDQATAPENKRTEKKSDEFLDRAKQGATNVGMDMLSSIIPKNNMDIRPGLNITGGLENPNSLVSKSASIPATMAKSLMKSENPIANFGLDIALDPRTYAMGPNVKTVAGQVEKGLMKATMNSEQMLAKSNKIMGEAEKLAVNILQPTTNELAEYIAKGKQLPSIKRGAESISRVKTFDELVGSLKNTTKELFVERDGILKEFNRPVGGEALESLSELSAKASKDMVLSPGKLKKFDEVFYREAQFLEQNPTMDIVTAQARKEKLQELTKPLLEKRKYGTLTGAESTELQAYDALRSGYRKAILKALPKDKANIVDKINSKYEGLMDATELAASQSAKSMKEVPQNIIDKVAASFGLSPKFTAFRLATKEFAGLVGKTKLEKTTGKIQELRNTAHTLRTLSDLAKKVK